MTYYSPSEKDLIARLAAACRSGNLEDARRVINFGAPVDAEFQYRTPLTTACEQGPTELVRLLLTRGADPNRAIRNGTPLVMVCTGRSSPEEAVKMCELLIDYGASLDLKCMGWIPLWYAARAGNVPMVRYLLDRGSAVGSTDPLSSPLWEACYYRKFDAARLLISRGADIRKTCEETLREFASIGIGLSSYRTVRAKVRTLSRTHWRRRILFHVIGRRAANPGSKRHELGLWRISDIASFLMVPE